MFIPSTFYLGGYFLQMILSIAVRIRGQIPSTCDLPGCLSPSDVKYSLQHPTVGLINLKLKGFSRLCKQWSHTLKPTLHRRERNSIWSSLVDQISGLHPFYSRLPKLRQCRFLHTQQNLFHFIGMKNTHPFLVIHPRQFLKYLKSFQINKPIYAK